MELIKKVAKETKKNKAGKDFRPIHYFIKTENGQYILVKPVFKEDYVKLNMVAKYVR